MGKALSRVLREDLIRLYKAGTSLTDICKTLSISYSVVRLHCKRYRENGESCLSNNYHNCGRRGCRIKPEIIETCLQLRRSRFWGSRRILVELKELFRSEKLPSERSINLLLQQNKLTEPREVHNHPSIGRSTNVHNIWQVDAKEQCTLKDGSRACYLTITDEFSGAWLSGIAFGYARIAQVPLEEVREALLQVFARWGKAGAFRVDNGVPFGNPKKALHPLLPCG